MQHQTLPQSKIEIQSALKEAFQSMQQYIYNLSESDFQNQYKGKWSAAEHLAHLIMSAFPVSAALKQNKEMFLAFGMSENGSLSYDELLQKYNDRLAAGQQADAKRIPTSKDISTKEEMLLSWETIQKKLLERIETWSESDLDKYQAPHPALGKITFRELLFFTIFHTQHHLNILKERESAA